MEQNLALEMESFMNPSQGLALFVLSMGLILAGVFTVFHAYGLGEIVRWQWLLAIVLIVTGAGQWRIASAEEKKKKNAKPRL